MKGGNKTVDTDANTDEAKHTYNNKNTSHE